MNNEPETPQETTQTGEAAADEAPDLDIQVGVENGKVIIVFSQRLSTVGMPPEAAETMGEALIKHAKEAREMTN